jgi:hypothetical protein
MGDCGLPIADCTVETMRGSHLGPGIGATHRVSQSAIRNPQSEILEVGSWQ